MNEAFKDRSGLFGYEKDTVMKIQMLRNHIIGLDVDDFVRSGFEWTINRIDVLEKQIRELETDIRILESEIQYG